MSVTFDKNACFISKGKKAYVIEKEIYSRFFDLYRGYELTEEGPMFLRKVITNSFDLALKELFK
ncbi:MAG: hypothetical protein K6F00_11220 [Lachnospiraceae bacterium]|nr:hypothetical protein [Lachnospiraceae bacterium]